MNAQETVDLLTQCLHEAIVESTEDTEGTTRPDDLITSEIFKKIFHNKKGGQKEGDRKLQDLLLTVLVDPDIPDADIKYVKRITGIPMRDLRKRFERAEERAVANKDKDINNQEFIRKRKEMAYWPDNFKLVAVGTWNDDEVSRAQESKAGDTEEGPNRSLNVAPIEAHLKYVKDLKELYPDHPKFANGRTPTLWWFNKQRPSTIVVGDRLSCLCVYHLQ